MKTNELTGAALEWAVDKCNFMQHSLESDYCLEVGYAPLYSIDWAHGGPIIEQEKIKTQYDTAWLYDPTDPKDNGERWYAELSYPVEYRSYGCYGPTALIAAMRCYVASKLGDDVEIPKELTP